MKKNQHGFSAIEALLILIIVGIVGFVGWYVWHNNPSSKKPANTSQTYTTLPSAEKKSPTIPEGWSLQKSKFGDLYLPTSEGSLNPVQQENGSSKEVNPGYLAVLKNYNIYFYDLSVPVLQYRGGFFNPCKYNYATNTLNAVTVKVIDGESFSTTSQNCNASSTTISGKQFLDFSYTYESRYQAGYLTTNKAKTIALLINSKQYDDPNCFTGVKNADTCTSEFDSKKNSLKGFISQLIEVNSSYFGS